MQSILEPVEFFGKIEFQNSILWELHFPRFYCTIGSVQNETVNNCQSHDCLFDGFDNFFDCILEFRDFIG